MKDYIRDNGKIRDCGANIAKMNPLEYWWHLDRWGLFLALRDCGPAIVNGVKAVLWVVAVLLGFWFLIPLRAVLIVRHARAEARKLQRVTPNSRPERREMTR